jgi:hypothetical protein
MRIEAHDVREQIARAVTCASRGHSAILKTLTTKGGSLPLHGALSSNRVDESLCAKNARLFPWLKLGHDVC